MVSGGTSRSAGNREPGLPAMTLTLPRGQLEKIFRAKSAQFSRALICPYLLDGRNGGIRKSVENELEKSESCVEDIRETGGESARPGTHNAGVWVPSGH